MLNLQPAPGERFELWLDGLDPSAFNALAFGAIQVDGRGRIYRYNMAEGRLSGRTPERMIGRNFFLDVAPCTNLPTFVGRFQEGVAAGALDVTFEFDFDFHMAPVRVEVRMLRAGEPDRYWIVVRKLADLKPNRPTDAIAMVAERSGVSVVGSVADFSACEREAIHTPGAIQPWGALLAVDTHGREIVAVSENASAMLGRVAVLGGDLATVIGEAAAADISSWLSDEQVPSWKGKLSLDGEFDLHAHRAGSVAIVEIERRGVEDNSVAATMLSELERDVACLRSYETLAELAQTVARSVRRKTGFERTIVYRFDADWHGEVIGEDKVADWDQSFAGMHFPASDIPRQARELYLRAPVRHVPNRDYTPVSIRQKVDIPSLDLSLARVRAISPVHLEYHRNMGVNASASFSIVVADRLWGLVVCHHRRPHFVASSALSAANTLVDTAALRISAVERAASNAGRNVDFTTLNALMIRMSAADTLISPLLSERPSILDLFGATGVVLRVDGSSAMRGEVPPPQFVSSLLVWLRDRWDGLGFYSSDSLSHEFLDAQAWRDCASGLFAMLLADGDHVLWFRAEQPRMLSWGGNPSKPMSAPGVRPLPRASFDRWIEERRGYADPWPQWTVEIATLLRHAIGDVMLRHLRQVAALNSQLRESNNAKARFLANMSHELRTPLNAIIGFSEAMRAGVGGPLSGRHAAYAEDIRSAGMHLLALINDILDISRIDAGRAEIRAENILLLPLVLDCVSMVSSRAVAKSVILSVAVPEGMDVFADPLRLLQILLNLTTNAVKFSPDNGRVVISARTLEKGLEIVVSDDGPGMTDAEIEVALQPFRQIASHTRRPEEGSGLGLPIAKALVELHGGTFEIKSNPGQGTHAIVRLPASPPVD